MTHTSPALVDEPSRYALRSAWLGGIVWLAALAWRPPSPLAPEWGAALLLLAPLVLVPLTLRLVEPDGTWIILRAAWRMAVLLQLPAAIVLLPAFFLSQGLIAVALALPWLITTLLIAFTGILRMRLLRSRVFAEISINAGLLYIAVGGVWLLLDRLGARPLQFEASIVMLTAIHFHYAGFLLPLFTGLAGRERQERTAKLAAIGVILGVPLVALGITATQLGFNPGFEALAALFTSCAGLVAAVLHMRVAWQQHSFGVKILFMLCGLALMFGMLQAALYGVRFYLVLEWPAIPWMRALHGTANALGFGLLGVLGWSFAARAGK